jgi:hypothetical protein
MRKLQKVNRNVNKNFSGYPWGEFIVSLQYLWADDKILHKKVIGGYV